MARNIHLQVFEKYSESLLDLLRPSEQTVDSLCAILTQKGLPSDAAEFNPEVTEGAAMLAQIKNDLKQNNIETLMKFLEALEEYVNETKPDPRLKAKQILQNIYKDIAIEANKLQRESVQDSRDMICDEASSSSCNVASSATGDCYPADMQGDRVPSSSTDINKSISRESTVATAESGGTAAPDIQNTPSKSKGGKRKQGDDDGAKTTAATKRRKSSGEMMIYQKISKKLPAYGVIINNQNFDKEVRNREGSGKDVKSIKQLKKLNIKFEHTLTDLTADEMEGALKFLATKDPDSLDQSKLGHGRGALKLLNVPEDGIKSYKNMDEIRGSLKGLMSQGKKNQLRKFEDYSCLMIFILTHGRDKGVLTGKDSSETTVENLSKIFNSKHCKDLENMPKVFFIQACRGVNFDEMTADQGGDQVCIDDKDDETTSFRVPQEADFLFVYAAPTGYVALRNPKSGSPFIQTLANVLLQTGEHNHHLEESLFAVKHEVAGQSFTVDYKQVKVIPSVVSQMRGKIKFDLSD